MLTNMERIEAYKIMIEAGRDLYDRDVIDRASYKEKAQFYTDKIAEMLRADDAERRAEG